MTFTAPRRLQVIQTMEDLEEALKEELIPISRTPLYFPEHEEKGNVVIITGDGDTFSYDAVADGDNKWVGASSDVTKMAQRVFNTPKKVRARVIAELAELEAQFNHAGFNNFHYLPASVEGMFNWIYINNAMAAGFNAEGKPYLYFSSMRNDNRKPEPVLVEFELRGLGGSTKNLLENIVVGRASGRWPMEGKGDQLPMSLPVLVNGRQSSDAFYNAVINCSGRRTSPEAIGEYAAQSGNYVIEIPLPDDSAANPSAAYHGNVGIFYFQKKDGTRGVTYIPEMLREDARNFVYGMFSTFFGKENVYCITPEMKEVYQEGTTNLSMNVISVGLGRIISSQNHPATNRFLERELGLEVLPVDMKAIGLGGGGLQCCYTALQHRELEIIRAAKYVGLPEL